MSKETEKEKKNLSALSKTLNRLNNINKDLLSSITQNAHKVNDQNSKELSGLNKKINDVLLSEMEDIKSFGGDDISTFILRTLNDKNKEGRTPLNNATFKNMDNEMKSLDDIFSGDNNDIFNAFNERYRNEALLLEDLDTIRSQLIELDEAINTTRDSIVTADDLGAIISRSLSFDTILDEESKDAFKALVEDIEDEYKLQTKIKNHIVPKALTYGKYYVYTIPQSKIFEDMQKYKIKKKKHGIAFEAAEFESEINAITENLVQDVYEDAEHSMFGFPRKDKHSENLEMVREEVTEYVKEYMDTIDVCPDDIALPVLETDIAGAAEDLLKFNDDFKKAVAKANGELETNKKSDNVFAQLDGVLGYKDRKSKSKDGQTTKVEDFSFIKDCYIQLLNPKQVRPIRIMQYTIGYFYVYETDLDPVVKRNKRKSSRFSTNFNLHNYDTTTNNSNIINIIANKIVKSFDKKYLEQNLEFKDAILSALTYHKIYNKTLHFQFIPAEYVCEFKINEDENGEGVSLLAKSLFYAKLYLALLMYSIILYTTRSSDTRIYYVKNSGIDTNYDDKVQAVARDIKSKQIKFTDLLSYNSIATKIGGGREIFMPVGKSNERGIEFDILSGQDVQLQNDLLEMLKQGYINGTGVPSVIMQYINEADYAKTLIMANAKHLSRVISYQLDFNESITKWYKMILTYTTSLSPEVIDGFKFKFLPPKSLVNNNYTDLTQYGDNIMDYMKRAVLGENAEATEENNLIKDIFTNRMSREIMPFLPWDTIDEVLKDATLEAKQILEQKQSEENGGETE